MITYDWMGLTNALVGDCHCNLNPLQDPSAVKFCTGPGGGYGVATISQEGAVSTPLTTAVT